MIETTTGAGGAANMVGYVYASGMKLATIAAAGEMTVTVTNTAGTTKVSRKTTVYLM